MLRYTTGKEGGEMNSVLTTLLMIADLTEVQKKSWEI